MYWIKVSLRIIYVYRGQEIYIDDLAGGTVTQKTSGRYSANALLSLNVVISEAHGFQRLDSIMVLKYHCIVLWKNRQCIFSIHFFPDWIKPFVYKMDTPFENALMYFLYTAQLLHSLHVYLLHFFTAGTDHRVNNQFCQKTNLKRAVRSALVSRAPSGLQFPGRIP